MNYPNYEILNIAGELGIATLIPEAIPYASNYTSHNGAKSLNPDAPKTIQSVGDLCDFKDWTDQPLFRCMYLPFGILIMLVRVLVLFVAGLLIFPFSRNTKCKIFQMVLWLLGIQIRRNRSHAAIEQLSRGAVTAINHVSVFDTFLALIHPNATVVLVHTPGSISQVIITGLLKISGANYWRVTDKRQLATSFKTWREAPQAQSLCVTPEGTINNGKGLFGFRPDFLVRGFPVVPTAVSIKTPFGVSAHPAEASGAKRFLRLFMMPWMHFDMAYLDKKTQAKGQSKADFVAEIQQDIANHLEIPATNWTAQQKHDYIRAFKMRKSK